MSRRPLLNLKMCVCVPSTRVVLGREMTMHDMSITSMNMVMHQISTQEDVLEETYDTRNGNVMDTNIACPATSLLKEEMPVVEFYIDTSRIPDIVITCCKAEHLIILTWNKS